MAENMTYAGAGVNYKGLDDYKRRAQDAAARTNPLIKRLGFNCVSWSRGESVFLIESSMGYFGLVVEGLGTKALVADGLRELAKEMEVRMRRTFHDNIAQCNVAMAVNDLVTLGLSPVLYNQYLAVQNDNWFKDENRANNLIQGTERACRLARCVWGGGETPALNGIIVPDTCDLAGATFGFAPKDRIINPDRIRAGDAIVIIESSGIHANGLTLARSIADKLPEGYLTKLPNGRTYGETLLDPTHIYVGLVEDCLDAGVDIHYAVNITGHGWRKFMRATQPFTYVIDTLPTQLPIFGFIQEHGPVDDREAYGNFNMGAGFALYIPEADVSTIINVAFILGLRAFRAGHVEAGEKKVVIEPKGLVYEGETLAVR